MVLISEVEPAVSDPRDELADADVISSGGEDFGAFAASRWPDLVRLAGELAGDRSAAADLAQAALARTSLAWWRVSRTGNPDDHVRRILIRASARVRRRSAGTEGAPGPVPSVRLDQIGHRARRIRSRRARIAAVPVLAGVVAAAALLIPDSHPATRLVPPGQQAVVTNTTAGPGSGAFAGGTADGRQWQLAVQDIADPGFRCLPGVSINGNDADPLFANPHPLRQSPVGDPAFLTLGSDLPGAGFGFIQVPADADWLWADPVGGFQLGVAPVTVTACGQQFRLAGFAYPLAATLRIHVSFRDRPEGNYTVPSALSAPRTSFGAPQVAGVWQGLDVTQGPVASGTIASGNAFGVRWSIRVTFGKAGDCFSISTSPPSGSTAGGLWQMACGPISTPQGPSTIMVLPLGSPHPGVVGVGYAVSVGSGVDHLTAELSDGSNVSARPLVVDGRKYAAFFTPGQLRMFWLNWVDATDRPIAGITGLPGYGYMQFWPTEVPAMTTEAWSTGWPD
jgi:DNA-directed RNA polymerase specialized sigma24 family protein